MSRKRKPWDARLAARARTTAVRHPDWSMTLRLTVLTVALALVGLLSDLRFGSQALGAVCYIAATVSGVVLVAFQFDKRRRVRRPPSR